MRGFEDGYVDIVDWIIRITDRIWEDQDVGYIYDTYRTGCRVYTTPARVYGVEPVVEADDPVDQRLPRQPALSPTTSSGPATRTRASRPPTAPSTSATTWGRGAGGRRPARKIQLWVIANCVSEENEIFEEWVLYNQVARLRAVRHRRATPPARRYGQRGTQPARSRRARSDRGGATASAGGIPVPAAEPRPTADDIEAD